MLHRDPNDFVQHIAFMQDFALRAGLIMRAFHSSQGVSFEMKPDRTRVTLADKTISDFFAKCIADRFPGTELLCEERGYRGVGGAGLKFVTDPVDGTDNYSRGLTEAVCALAFMQGPIAWSSVVHAPLLREPITWTANLKEGTYRNGERVHVSDGSDGLQIAIATANAPNELYNARNLTTALEAQGHTTTDVQSISHSCAQLAEGLVDAVFFPWNSLHDTVPGYILVTEAGGCASDLFGEDLCFDGRLLQGFVMANTKHTILSMLEIVRPHLIT